MPLLQTLGWTFVHFLWQGLAIALAAWALLVLCRSARLRYAIGCGALLAMLAAPALTFSFLIDRATLSPQLDPTRTSAIPFDERSIAVPLEPAAITAVSPTWRDRAAVAVVPWLGRCWIGGVIVLACWQGAGVEQLRRMRRRSAPLDDPHWQARLHRLADRLAIRRRVNLFVSEQIDCPAVIGFIKPAILWPAAALSGLTPKQIDALLTHELAHISRHDDWINLLQVGVETVLFFHPCVWWLSRRVRQERENCCDDLAAIISGNRVEYAGALIAMESLRQTHSLALQANGGSLMKRIQRLLEPTALGTHRSRGVSGAIALVALAAIASSWASHSRADDSANAPALPTTAPAAQIADAAPISEPTTQPQHVWLRSVEIDPDYAIQPSDVVQLRIVNLAGDGSVQIESGRVSESGDISLPNIPKVAVKGLTEIAAEERVLEALKTIRPDVKVRLTIVQRLVPLNLTTSDALTSDPNYQRLVVERQSALAEMRQRTAALGEAHPKVREAQQRIESIEKQIEEITSTIESKVAKAMAEIDASRMNQSAENALKATAANPDIAARLMERNGLNDKLAALSRSFGPDSPAVRDMQAQVEQLNKRLAEMAAQLKPKLEAARARFELARERASVAEVQAADAAQHALRESRKERFRSEGRSPSTQPEVGAEARGLSRLDAESAAAQERKSAEDDKAESTLAKYQRLSKDRDEVLAAIQAENESASPRPAKLAELTALRDTIQAQIEALTTATGEYYIAGNVKRPGVYALSGRRISLKQAIASAGYENLAQDTQIQIIRRNAADKTETTITRSLAELFDRAKKIGEDGGDLFLLPDDQVIVGWTVPADPRTLPLQ